MNELKEHDEWFEKQSKSLIKRGVIIWLLGLVMTVCAIGGIIFFIFWCLKHFGVIGA